MTVGVYGLGRFGYFWAEQLAQFLPVKGYSRSPKTHYPKDVAIVSEHELLQCDAIFLCVSISSLEDVLKRIAPHIKKGATILDTCSVKSYPAYLMKHLLGEEVQSIATHPMFGPDSGSKGLAGLPLVLSPVKADDETTTFWINQFKKMELKVVEMSCDQHDKESAYSQGVTHFIGRVLDELDLKNTELATVGYKSLLTIVEQTCNDPLQLFYDLQRYNPYTHDMHIKLKEALDKMLAVLEEQERLSVEIS
ncbi:MAG: prephenate dehydrogenase/arogenate dehydrogenase family protein [Sphaerochaetaceae bacterium]|jgi:arogenate dehydrogenase (NADP+)